jgi:hypothetical protein
MVRSGEDNQVSTGDELERRGFMTPQHPASPYGVLNTAATRTHHNIAAGLEQ